MSAAHAAIASDYIWSLVSGFPRSVRNRRWLLMLQTYLDDSGIGRPPASVLAGWVASAENWAAFSDEWQEALDMRPRIAYFKMNEAASFSGEFLHWSEARRDERVALLFSIIERHAFLAVATVVPDHLYRSVFAALKKDVRFLEYPYFLLFIGIISSVSQHFAKAGVVDPIDFIFDSQPDQMRNALNGWELFSSMVVPDNIKQLISNPPIFRSDKTTLPLQAADFHAWWTRRMCETHFLGKPEIEPPWHRKKKIPSLMMAWREESLKRMRAKLQGSEPFWPIK